jgi:hypothetical protein
MKLPTASNVSVAFAPEGSRSQQADAMGPEVPTITLKQIQEFNRKSEKALMGNAYIPASGPKPLFYQYANTHRLQRLLLLETLDFLHEVGCPFPVAKSYGPEPFLQLHLWGVFKGYQHPELTIEEAYYLFTFEWEKVKSVFYEGQQRVPQTFLESYRSAAERVLMHLAPEMKRGAYVAGGSCGAPGNAISQYRLNEGESDELSERVQAYVDGRPFIWDETTPAPQPTNEKR